MVQVEKHEMYHVTAIAVKLLCPSATALCMAVRSAQTVRP